MELLFSATRWGAEEVPFEAFLNKIKAAGYNAIDTWIPEERSERQEFIRLLAEYEVPIVCHQHQANGKNIKEFCNSFDYFLNLSMECDPLLINSHSGKDYFSVDDQLTVIDTAASFSDSHNITVLHETHRGRICYSPYNAQQLFNLRPDMRITADLSHWVCVTESLLEHCMDTVTETIMRAEHIHARVGFPEGPQVPDPRMHEYKIYEETFMNWWISTLKLKKEQGLAFFTITPEFGPPPYMMINPDTGHVLANQFSINNYIKDEIKMRWNECNMSI